MTPLRQGKWHAFELIKPTMKNLSRRIFIKKSTLSGLGLLGIVQFSTINAATKATPKTMMTPLLDVLRSTHKPVCEAAATELAALTSNPSSYNLHLRNASLTPAEIEHIAKAIKTVDDDHGPALQSFSMSYNPKLRNEGVLSLVHSLPATVTEIGLVGCGVGDHGAKALITWVAKAPKLRMLCVEQNALSSATKVQLLKLSEQRPHLLVVV
jgi:hypothetical protein